MSDIDKIRCDAPHCREELPVFPDRETAKSLKRWWSIYQHDGAFTLRHMAKPYLPYRGESVQHACSDSHVLQVLSAWMGERKEFAPEEQQKQEDRAAMRW